MIENKPQRLHAVIYGRVQGVGFRAFVARSAQNLGLKGWVRNRFNGTVETIVEGDRAQLESFLRDLNRGPVSSNVTKVKADWSDAIGEFNNFIVRMTS